MNSYPNPSLSGLAVKKNFLDSPTGDKFIGSEEKRVFDKNSELQD